jgi:3-deoxy-D-manno-octulosonic-acid transferase
MHIAALRHPKARQWVRGRKEVWEKLTAFRGSTDPGKRIYWMHCASLGEFEQGRPLLEKLKTHDPGSYSVLTFFSPSGYEIRKDYPHADLVCYLPADTPANAHRFISLLQPHMAIFVKYEFWRHYLHQLHRRQIPTILISAIFRPEQLFFRSYGAWYRRLLTYFDHFFVQNESSARLLASVGVTNYAISGDTRVDRVLQLQKEAPEFPLIADFCGSAPVWIIGSSWPADEDLLFSFWQDRLPPHWRIIIAPHEIGAAHLQQIEQTAPLPLVRYSTLKQQAAPADDARILLIDNVGMLSALYRYGRIAYIGGGFGKAIHNLLEPMAFHLPVIFGPKHEKFQEALTLKKSGGGFAISGREDLERVFTALQDEKIYEKAARAAYDYLEQSQGGTDKILTYITTFAP